MISKKPYLIRAIYQWIIDNKLTPYISVACDHPSVYVPKQFVRDGQITLNISEQATQNLAIDNDWISFNARFSGVEDYLRFPVALIQAIFAQENSQGMRFDLEVPPATQEKQSSDQELKSRAAKPVLSAKKTAHLTIIK